MGWLAAECDLGVLPPQLLPPLPAQHPLFGRAVLAGMAEALGL